MPRRWSGPGGVIGHYRKIHLPHLGIDRFVDRGDIPTPSHMPRVKIGLAICYDSSFPEPMRVLGASGGRCDRAGYQLAGRVRRERPRSFRRPAAWKTICSLSPQIVSARKTVSRFVVAVPFADPMASCSQKRTATSNDSVCGGRPAASTQQANRAHTRKARDSSLQRSPTRILRWARSSGLKRAMERTGGVSIARSSRQAVGERLSRRSPKRQF